MVGQRSKEIALRIAIGARGQEVRRMVLRRGLKPVTAGLLIGLATAALSVGALRSMLHQTRPLDPVTFVAVAVLLSGCATIACLLPALRASRIDPAATLRGE